jgi:signal transduction histidine kinase/DNA-binding response OmpR family regulator
MASTIYTDKAKILVVDDRAENLLVFKAMLDELGQQIITAKSGEDALKFLLDNDVAVVLMDVNMPGMDGLETAALIRGRKRSAHTPIIFLTAYVEEVHTVKGYSVGAVDYIMTPVLPDILRSKVRVFVQLYLMTCEAERQADQRIALAHEQAARAAAEKSIQDVAFLAEASHLLGNSLDVKATIKALGHHMVPFLSDLSALVLVDAHCQPNHAELTWLGSDGISNDCHSESVITLVNPEISNVMQTALSSGNTKVITELVPGYSTLQVTRSGKTANETLELGFEMQSFAILPLLARGYRMGALVLGYAGQLKSTQLALAEEIATRTSAALDNCLLYEKVQEADHRKNEFLAMLSHELRNPLAPLRNAIQILRTPTVKTTDHEWALDVADRQAKQLVRLVDDLLDVARVTQGKIMLQLEAVDVATVMSLAVEMSRPLIDVNRHQLTLTVPPLSLYILADHSRVAQILANLLNNAAKYTKQGGQISLSAKEEGADIVFRVRDSGIGIPQHMISSIFDLFVQADQSLDRSQGGLGIGLTIAHRLVKMQGGSMEVHSAGVGQGSEFVVRLQRTEKVAIKEISKPLHRSSFVHRILVVDDYVDSAESMAAVLKSESHEVHIAHDGPTAIEMVRRVQPSLIFLDIGLPGMSGFEVARKLRAMPETKESLIIAVTGYGHMEDHLHTKEAGFDHHLVKPVDPVTLHEVLKMIKVHAGSKPNLLYIPTAA